MKYIVYLTTNTVNKKIYVGVHKTETPYDFDGYLGCGVKINDRSTYRFCHTPFETAVNKYGPDKFIRKTIYVFDTLLEAVDKEIEIVNDEFIRRKDTYNVTLGGGIPPAPCKQIYLYDLSGKFIKEWPSITEAALYYKCSSSAIGKAVFDRTPSKKFLWTDTKYDKLDVTSFKIDQNKTKCYLYDDSGEFVKEFRSITDCAYYLEVTSGVVSKAIKGKFSILGKWYCSDVKYEHFNIPIIVAHDKVYQYDLQGNFVKELTKWNSYVNTAVRCGTPYKGYQYSWEKVPFMKALEVKPLKRKVGKYTKDGVLVATFDSVRDAKKDTCGAPHVLAGLRKTAGGCIWKYIED